MSQARTFYMDSNLNVKSLPYPQCIVYGKAVSIAKYSVWTANDLDAVHPEDIELVNKTNESGQCWLVYIGNDCAKKIPKQFLVLNEE